MSDYPSPQDGGTPKRQPAVLVRIVPVVLVLLTAVVAVLSGNVWLATRLLEQRSSESREHAFWVLCQPGHSPAERVGAFRQLAAEGNKEWRSAQLSDLNLEGLSLPGAELMAAGFQRVNLKRANLAGANLRQASLELADLSGAELNEADLAETRLYRAVI